MFKKLTICLTISVALATYNQQLTAGWFSNLYTTIRNNKEFAILGSVALASSYFIYTFFKKINAKPVSVRLSLPAQQSTNLLPEAETSIYNSDSVIDVNQLPISIPSPVASSADIALNSKLCTTSSVVTSESNNNNDAVHQQQASQTNGHGNGIDKKKKKNVSFLSDSKIQITQEISKYSHSFDGLPKYLNIRMKEIENHLRCVKEKNTTMLGEFVVIGLTEHEYTKAMASFKQTIGEEFNNITNPEFKKQYTVEIQKYINKLTDLNNSVFCVSLRITDEPKELYVRFEQSLSHLAKVGIDAKNAYEILGFDKINRFAITIDQIDARYKTLSDQYDRTETEEGKKVRQAGFTLNNQFGKELYDAYLTGPEALEMFAISTQDAENFGINQEALTQEILTYKQTLEYLLKQLR